MSVRSRVFFAFRLYPISLLCQERYRGEWEIGTVHEIGNVDKVAMTGVSVGYNSVVWKGPAKGIGYDDDYPFWWSRGRRFSEISWEVVKVAFGSAWEGIGR